MKIKDRLTGYAIRPHDGNMTIARCADPARPLPSYISPQDKTTELRANISLIAAAPELLESLRIMTDHAQERYPHFESTRGQKDIAGAIAAIKRAEGRE